jgi:hypothetical protein
MHLTLEQYLEIERKTKELERQIEALKKWIKYNTDVEIEMDGLVEEMEGLFPDTEQEPTMTSKELEYYISKIEMYSDVFNYGRIDVEEKKMAESL